MNLLIRVFRPLPSSDSEGCRDWPHADVQHRQRRFGSTVCRQGMSCSLLQVFATGRTNVRKKKPERRQSLCTSRSPCCSTGVDLGKSSASTCGSEAAETTAERPVASIKSQPSPPCTSCGMRTTWWRQTCRARSELWLSIIHNSASIRIDARPPSSSSSSSQGPLTTSSSSSLVHRSSCGTSEWPNQCRSTRGTTMNTPTFRFTCVKMRGFCWQVGRKEGAVNIPLLLKLQFQSLTVFFLLSSAGQDCYTRLWSLRDGRLLRTIPSPHPAANDLIPSVVFSSKLGGRRGLPGLLMAVKHDLYYFPYNADYQDIEDSHLVQFAKWRSFFSSFSLDSQTSEEDDLKVWP